MPQKPIIALTSVILACTSGCSLPFFSNGNAKVPINKLGIVGAKALLIGQNTSSQQYRIASETTTSGDTLFRLDPDNTISRVRIEDTQGKEIQGSLKPLGIANVGKDYLCLSWGEQPGRVAGIHQAQAGTYLIRKSDGKALKLEDCPAWPEQLGRFVQTDKEGNLYFVANMGGVLYKISCPSPEGVATKTALSKTDTELMSDNFAVDPDGNIVIAGRLVDPALSPNAPGFVRVYRPTGAIQLLWSSVSEPSAPYRFLTGSNGTIYALSANSSATSWSDCILKVFFNPEAKLISIPGTEGFTPFSNTTFMNSSKLMISNGKLIWGSNAGIKVFLEASETVETTQLSGIISIDSMQTAGGYFYILGKDPKGSTALIRFDPNTREEKSLFTDNSHLICNFAVTPLGEVTLNALRLLDGKYSVIKIDSAGAITTLSDSMPKLSEIVIFE